jgi:hypothetical protein
MADQTKGPHQGANLGLNLGKGSQKGPQDATMSGVSGGDTAGAKAATPGMATGSAGGYAPGADAKKPSAIIDLKAVEIKDSKSTVTSAGTTGAAMTGASKPVEPVKPTVASSAASSSAASSSTASATPSPSSVPKTGATPTGSSNGGKPADPKSPGKPAVAATLPVAKPTSGLGAMLSHAFAGILGGLLALLGADTLSQSLGLKSQAPDVAGATTQLEQRLAVLEKSTKAGGPAVAGDAGPKLAAAEARLAKLEELSKVLPGLTETQARLTAESKALNAKVDTPLGADPAARLAKLEQTLTTLSDVSAADPQKGRIPQLAQLSGKIADLESALQTQLAATRKSITTELDTRLGQSTETSEAAKSGTVRIDRDLATVKTDAARTAQAVETLGATLKSVQADTGTLKASVDDLTGQLKSVARPQDVTAALAPMTSKLSGLEQNLQGVVKNEDDRRTQSERMVLALELGNLKRALDRGGAYASELADVEKSAGGKLNLAALAKFKDQGVPTVASLTGDFRTVAHAAVAADAEPAKGGVVDRFLASAKNVVRVRKVDGGADDKGVEAVVARIEAALKAGRLGDIAGEAKALSPRALAMVEPWLAKVDVRGGVDRTVAEIETQLKASLSGRPVEKVKP